jgi:hypothetical protein
VRGRSRPGLVQMTGDGAKSHAHPDQLSVTFVVRPACHDTCVATAFSDGTTMAGGAAWPRFAAAPPLDLEPPTAAELDAVFRGGEADAELCERVLASAARACGAVEVQLAEGLAALRQGDRLAELGCHLDDYAREALDLGKSAAEKLARLGAGLRTRPLLREALRSGRVRLRAAQTVLPVAAGDEEALWVERAARCTVRELEAAVRRARGGDPDPEDEWVRLGVRLEPDERRRRRGARARGRGAPGLDADGAARGDVAGGAG